MLSKFISNEWFILFPISKVKFKIDFYGKVYVDLKKNVKSIKYELILILKFSLSPLQAWYICHKYIKTNLYWVQTLKDAVCHYIPKRIREIMFSFFVQLI